VDVQVDERCLGHGKASLEIRSAGIDPLRARFFARCENRSASGFTPLARLSLFGPFSPEKGAGWRNRCG
jgi:hypothetical protein